MADTVNQFTNLLPNAVDSQADFCVVFLKLRLDQVPQAT